MLVVFYRQYCIEFEVNIAALAKSFLFWAVSLRSPANVNRHFGGIYRLHLQGSRVR
jgi:hypothetical protein